MKHIRSALLLALGVAFAGTVAAHPHKHLDCDVESDYSLSVDAQGVKFASDKHKPSRITMRRGELVVDGQLMALSATDKARVASYEDRIRGLVPEVRAIALDAVDIAFTAITEVVRTLSTNAESATRTIARLDRIRAEAVAKLSGNGGTPLFDARQFERIIEDTVSSAIPEVVGDVTAAAIRLAFSGDGNAAEALERRADRLEEDLERAIESRAKALEKRADALCPKIAELDTIESELEVRLADGRPINLVSTNR